MSSIRSLDRAEEEFAAFGPIARVARDADNNGKSATLSGAQVLRRTVAELTGFKMNAKQLARQGLDDASARVAIAIAMAEKEASAAGDSLEDLFEKMKSLVPTELHEHCASLLVASGAVRKSGSAADRRIISMAEQFNRRRAYDRRPRTMDEAVAVLSEINRRDANANANAS